MVHAAVRPEDKVPFSIGNVVERNRRERFHEGHSVLRDELVLEPAVHDYDISGLEPLPLSVDGHIDLTIDDEHRLLRVSMAMERHLLAWFVHDATQQHLLAADRVQSYTVDELEGVNAVPCAKWGLI